MLRKYLLMVICCFYASYSSAEIITLKTAYGTPFNAYVAGPEDADIGIALAHDRWGLAQEAKNWADRLGKQGYRVVVADLYDGRRVRDELMTSEVMGQTAPEWVIADINGALDYLKQRQRKVALMGWGYGAKFSYQVAADENADIDALIAFYALPQGPQQALAGIDVPMLGVFGRQDLNLSMEKVDEFQQVMLQLRKILDVVSINAAAGFVNPQNKTYQVAASNEAWDATQQFLKRHLIDE